MKDLGKRNVLGVLVDAVDYEAAVERILRAAKEGMGFSATALAVHGVMTGVLDAEQRFRLNSFDLVTPDGQPVRWALNVLHRTGLRDRVYGPVLATGVLSAAQTEGLPIYFYGSTDTVLKRLDENVRERWPHLIIAGGEASKFRRTTAAEKAEIVQRVRSSGARLLFVGLGCPRQEIFVFEYSRALEMPVVAVGAAFDYHSGALRQPPLVIQRWGLQWLYRLFQEPRRLWRRYLLLNPLFLLLLALQLLRLWRPDPSDCKRPGAEILYG